MWGVKENRIGWDKGGQQRQYATMFMVKDVYLRSMDNAENLGAWAALRLGFRDLQQKNDLIKVSLALDALLSKLHNASSLMQFLRGHLPYFAAQDLKIEDLVTLELLSMLCFLHFNAMQPGPDNSCGEFTGKNGDGVKVLSKFRQDPVASGFELKGCSHPDLWKATAGDSPKIQEGRIHAKWVSHDLLIPMMKMFLMNLPQGGPADATEVQVRTVFADLLSSISTAVKVRINNTVSLQNKMLSLFTTGATTLSGYALHLWSGNSQHGPQ